jgi:hypothetical protein
MQIWVYLTSLLQNHARNLTLKKAGIGLTLPEDVLFQIHRADAASAICKSNDVEFQYHLVVLKNNKKKENI